MKKTLKHDEFGIFYFDSDKSSGPGALARLIELGWREATSSDLKLTGEEKNKIAKSKRASEYPPVGDALDALAKWAFTETEIGLPAELKSWAAKCMAVKSKYPIED